MVRKQITWTTKALQDRTAIYEYWYQRTRSIDYPIQLEALFKSALRILVEHPNTGVLFNKKRSIRFVIIKHYRLYYTFSDSELAVLRIWDTRRNENSFTV